MERRRSLPDALRRGDPGTPVRLPRLGPLALAAALPVLLANLPVLIASLPVLGATLAILRATPPIVGATLLAAGCSAPNPEVTELRHYPLDAIEEIVARSGVEIDQRVTSDGKASLRLTAVGPTVVHLVETGDIDVENAMLVYQADVRAEGVQGQVYLEMLCNFPGRGEFFSRGVQHALTGSTSWVTSQTPFYLRQGENPDNVWLNVVFTGPGVAWIDDVRLLESRG